MFSPSVDEAFNFIKKNTNITPKVGLILGSGLGVLADEIENKVSIPFKDIPHFPESTVVGHKGQLVIGELMGKQVVAMQGRFHFYEGYSMSQVVFPVRVMKKLGIKSLIVTNAAGGINKNFSPGDLMIITDHINNMGTNPLIGPNDDQYGDRFPDMSKAYDPNYIDYAKSCAEDLGMTVQTGVYIGNSGPAYETPAEINMLRVLGGDAVGMSTVPEVIVARHIKLRVLGISCISNMAAGVRNQALSHDEVMDTTKKVQASFLKLLKHIIHNLPDEGVNLSENG